MQGYTDWIQEIREFVNSLDHLTISKEGEYDGVFLVVPSSTDASRNCFEDGIRSHNFVAISPKESKRFPNAIWLSRPRRVDTIKSIIEDVLQQGLYVWVDHFGDMGYAMTTRRAAMRAATNAIYESKSREKIRYCCFIPLRDSAVISQIGRLDQFPETIKSQCHWIGNVTRSDMEFIFDRAKGLVRQHLAECFDVTEEEIGVTTSWLGCEMQPEVAVG